MDTFNILDNIISTILGGLIITLFLFVFDELLFKKANITGEWKAIVKINSTSYNKFKDLKIEFRLHLLQKGFEILGSGEKIKDIHQNGCEEEFDRKDRIVLKISGYYERKYLSKSKLFLNIIEEGKERQSRSLWIFPIKNNKILIGEFSSTAADSKGIVCIQRL
jgi:hypothetical protein